MEYTDSLHNTITMDDDRMTANMTIRPKPDGLPYSVDELKDMLKTVGIKFGILEEKLEQVVNFQIYGKSFLAAQGKPAQDGKDGEFELLFRTELPSTPKEKADGSVDYLNVDLFEQVRKNQKIAIYHKATGGTAGFTLTGQILMPKKGKEVPALRGKGFHISSDGMEYFSDIDGKVEFKNGRIEIANYFEIKDDVDSTYGNVTFKGDVVINGAVRTGMRVVAGGSVTITGVVEGAEITAGGDVLLRSGVLGNGKCFISSDGNVIGKFIENANVMCKGKINCNYLMNCNVSAWKGVELEGRRSSIIGGRTSSLNYIKVNNIGNDVELPTHVQVGIDTNFYSKVTGLQKKVEQVASEIAALEKALHSDIEDTEKIVTIVCQKVNEKMDLEKQLDGMKELMVNARGAFISVKGTAYPRTTVQIDVVQMTLSRKVDYVTFRRKNNAIITYSQG